MGDTFMRTKYVPIIHVILMYSICSITLIVFTLNIQNELRDIIIIHIIYDIVFQQCYHFYFHSYVWEYH